MTTKPGEYVQGSSDSAYGRAWYHRNKEARKKQIAKRVAENQRWMDEHKAGLSCVRCGFSHPACLEFHHRVPADKTSEVSKMVRDGRSLKSLQQEMAKCDVLCANCHRILHWEQKRLLVPIA